jgi:hypothetical protein
MHAYVCISFFSEISDIQVSSSHRLFMIDSGTLRMPFRKLAIPQTCWTTQSAEFCTVSVRIQNTLASEIPTCAVTGIHKMLCVYLSAEFFEAPLREEASAIPSHLALITFTPYYNKASYNGAWIP